MRLNKANKGEKDDLILYGYKWQVHSEDEIEKQIQFVVKNLVISIIFYR